MQRRVAELSEIHKNGPSVRLLKSNGGIHCDRGGASAALGIGDRENARSSGRCTSFRMQFCESSECVGKIFCSGVALQIFPGAGTHGGYDCAGIGQRPKRKYGNIRDISVNDFYGPRGGESILRIDIDQHNFSARFLDSAYRMIGCAAREYV